MKPTPICSMEDNTAATEVLRSKPTYSKKSALPHSPDIDLFPCFATQAPLPAATRAAAVLILGVLIESPPVPHISTIDEFRFGVRRIERPLIDLIRYLSSLAVSFFIVSATKKATTDSWDNRSVEIKSIDVSISPSVNSFLEISFLMRGWNSASPFVIF